MKTEENDVEKSRGTIDDEVVEMKTEEDDGSGATTLENRLDKNDVVSSGSCVEDSTNNKVSGSATELIID